MSRIRNSALALSAAGLVAIAVSEGYRSHTYDDGVGVNTVGFGTAYVKPGTTMTVERALIQLNADADKMQKGMRACLGDVPMYQYEWDAWVSFTYNVGVGAFCKSTAVKKLKAGDYEGACNEMTRFVRAGGRVLPGLVKRRAEERRACLGEKT